MEVIVLCSLANNRNLLPLYSDVFLVSSGFLYLNPPMKRGNPRYVIE